MKRPPKSGSAKKKGRAAKKVKPGTPFEVRARHAIGVVHPELRVEHNVSLDTRYGRKRQIDVAAFDPASGALMHAFEAKDRSRRVGYDPVAAFDHLGGRLKAPATGHAGLVSSRGFQQGPIDMVRAGETDYVKRLYQLREVEEADWEGLIRSFQLTVVARTVSCGRVTLLAADPHDTSIANLRAECERPTAFLRAGDGTIVGNVVDIVGERLREIVPSLPDRDAPPPQVHSEVLIEFPEPYEVRLGDTRVRIRGVRWVPAESDLESAIHLDQASSPRDTLIDCITNQKHLIPDPEKALAAARNGYDLALSYKDQQSASLDELAFPEGEPDDEPSRVRELMNGKLLVELSRLHRAAEDNDDIVALIRDDLRAGAEALERGDDVEAESLYWKTCGVATSLEALANLTYIYHARGSLTLALRWALRTIELFAVEAKGYVNAATILLDLGRVDEAARVLRSGRIFHPEHPELLEQEVRYLRQTKAWLQALPKAHLLTSSVPNEPRYRLALAVCELELGRYEEAAWDAFVASRLVMTEQLLSLSLDIMLAGQRWKDACEVGLAALNGDALSPSVRDEVRTLVAFAACELGELDVAARLVRGVEPQSVEGLWVHGNVAYAERRPSDARSCFAELLRLAPASWGAHRGLVLAEMALGNFAGAFELVRESSFAGRDVEETYRLSLLSGALVASSEHARAWASALERLGCDAAGALLDAGGAAVQVEHHQVANELRTLSLEFSPRSADAARFALKMHTIGHWSERTSRETLERALERAAGMGVGAADLECARLCLAICARDASAIVAAPIPVIRDGTDSPERLFWAIEIASCGCADAAMQLLEGVNASGLQLGPFALPPPDAVRAMCALIRGDALGVVRSLIESFDGDTHPYSIRARAYWYYRTGEVGAALAMLKSLNEDLRRLEAGLELQCLLEQQRNVEAAQLVTRVFEPLPIAQAAQWWGREPSGVRVHDHIAQAGAVLGILRSTTPSAEHILVLLSPARRPTSMACLSWESSFLQFAAVPAFADRIPIIVRMVADARGTTARLLHAYGGRPTEIASLGVQQHATYFHPVAPALYDDPVIGPILRQLEQDDPDVIAAIAEVDRSLIQANLELTPEERLARNARSLTTLSEARRDRT